MFLWFEEIRTSVFKKYGFADEVKRKFGSKHDEFLKSIARVYDLMPVVIYVGCENNYLQCCHGGMEPGYDPSELLDSDKELQFIESR